MEASVSKLHMAEEVANFSGSALWYSFESLSWNYHNLIPGFLLDLNANAQAAMNEAEKIKAFFKKKSIIIVQVSWCTQISEKQNKDKIILHSVIKYHY